MDVEDWRALRGLVLHVLRPARKNGCSDSRDAVGYMGMYRDGIVVRTGTCHWCRRPAPSRRHAWHPRCAYFYNLARGKSTAYGNPLGFSYDSVCDVCGAVGTSVRPTETDHIVALAVARERGPDAMARSYLPGNLRPLCHACHVVKTTADRRELKRLRSLSEEVTDDS